MLRLDRGWDASDEVFGCSGREGSDGVEAAVLTVLRLGVKSDA